MTPRRLVSPANKEELRAMRRDGVTLQEIAQRTGLKVSTVSTYLSRANVKAPPGSRVNTWRPDYEPIPRRATNEGKHLRLLFEAMQRGEHLPKREAA